MSTKIKGDEPDHKPTLAERAAASRQALADALANVPRHEADVAGAITRQEAIRAAWARGDDSISRSALTEAKEDEERAAALLAAARRAVEVADRNVLNDVPDLAEAVASALGRTIYGLPILTVCEEPETPDALPVLYAVQVKPSKRETIDGTINGTVDLVLYGLEHTKPLDADEIRRRLHGTGVVLRHEPARHRDASGSLHKNVVSLDIASAWAPVPVITGEPQEWRIRGVASDLAHRITHRMQSPTAPTLGYHVGGSGSTASVTVPAKAGESAVVSTSVASGVRRTVVRAGVSAWSTDSGYDADRIAKTMRGVVTESEGQCMGGLGRIDSAKVLHMEPTGAYNRGRHVEAEFVFVSRQG